MTQIQDRLLKPLGWVLGKAQANPKGSKKEKQAPICPRRVASAWRNSQG